MRRSDRRLSDEDYRTVRAALVTRARDWIGLARVERAALGWGLARRSAQHRRAWMLMGEAGLRLAEACGVLWRDVIMEGRIVRTLRLPARIAKGGHEREIPVSEHLAEALEEGWAVEQGYEEWMDGAARLDVSMRVLGCGRRQVERWIANVTMQELGRELHPHALRHYAGNRWRRVSGDIAVCQKLLGHIDPKTTMIYTRVGGEELAETVRMASHVGEAPERSPSCRTRAQGLQTDRRESS